MNHTLHLVCENDKLTDVNRNLLGVAGGDIVQDALKPSDVSAIGKYLFSYPYSAATEFNFESSGMLDSGSTVFHSGSSALFDSGEFHIVKS